MAVNRNITNIVYGLNNPAQILSPEPIFARRAPSSDDSASIGTFWFYTPGSNNPVQVYIFVESGTWSEISFGSGTATFSSLQVTGTSLLQGALTVNSGTGAISIGTDAVAKVITLGNATGTTGVVINSGTGDIALTSADAVTVDAAGVLELNSSAGAISIGNDAVAQAINIGTGAAARTITVGNATGATALVFNAGSGLSKFNSGVATAPVNSSVATAAFVSSLSAGTSVQNTTGYDLLCNISFIVSSATTATITLGVGASTGPTANTVIQSFTSASSIIVPIVAWVPNNYYLVYNTTGTITVASAQVQSCPL